METLQNNGFGIQRLILTFTTTVLWVTKLFVDDDCILFPESET